MNFEVIEKVREFLGQPSDLQMPLIYVIICLLKAGIILNVKIIPSNTLGIASVRRFFSFNYTCIYAFCAWYFFVNLTVVTNVAYA